MFCIFIACLLWHINTLSIIKSITCDFNILLFNKNEQLIKNLIFNLDFKTTPWAVVDTCWWLVETAERDDVKARDADVSLPGSSWDRLANMADSLSTGLGEEKEKEKEDRERDRNAAKNEKNKEKDGVTETLGFNDRNSGRKDKKRNLSGES